MSDYPTPSRGADPLPQTDPLCSKMVLAASIKDEYYQELFQWVVIYSAPQKCPLFLYFLYIRYELAPTMELLNNLTFVNKGFLSNFYHRRRIPNPSITAKSGLHRKLFTLYVFFQYFLQVNWQTKILYFEYLQFHPLKMMQPHQWLPIFQWTHIKNKFSFNMKQTDSKYLHFNRR